MASKAKYNMKFSLRYHRFGVGEKSANSHGSFDEYV